MLFNSITFFIFLPTVLILYWCFRKKLNLQNVILLLSSYVFYGWWDYRFLSLIIASTIVDYFVGLKIHKTHAPHLRKLWLLVSLIFNLGLLCFFKYYNFFVDSWVDAMSVFGFTVKNTWSLQIILPVGISFYTFQTLSYSIDIYRKKISPTKNIIGFAAFVAFFPQLVAGPIERASNLLPQILAKRTYKLNHFSAGIKMMIWGFFLKLVVADRAAIYVNAVYNNVENHDGLTLIVATIMFSFQIYGDFAGYSLIAIGTAKLFGIDLMTNFKRPYYSRSIGEFWKRWHISLSTWFKDYVYIPLGGNRTKKHRWFFNLFVTFLISGLWHGANWTFVIWGALNGIYLIIEAILFKKQRKGVLNILITFILINFSWIFFRANSLEDAWFIVNKVVNKPGYLYFGFGEDITAFFYSIIAIGILLLVETKREFMSNRFSLFNNKHEWVRLTSYAFVVFIIFYLGVFGESQFIYFQF